MHSYSQDMGGGGSPLDRLPIVVVEKKKKKGMSTSTVTLSGPSGAPSSSPFQSPDLSQPQQQENGLPDPFVIISDASAKTRVLGAVTRLPLHSLVASTSEPFVNTGRDSIDSLAFSPSNSAVPTPNTGRTLAFFGDDFLLPEENLSPTAVSIAMMTAPNNSSLDPVYPTASLSTQHENMGDIPHASQEHSSFPVDELLNNERVESMLSWDRPIPGNDIAEAEDTDYDYRYSNMFSHVSHPIFESSHESQGVQSGDVSADQSIMAQDLSTDMSLAYTHSEVSPVVSASHHVNYNYSYDRAAQRHVDNKNLVNPYNISSDSDSDGVMTRDERVTDLTPIQSLPSNYNTDNTSINANYSSMSEITAGRQQFYQSSRWTAFDGQVESAKANALSTAREGQFANERTGKRTLHNPRPNELIFSLTAVSEGPDSGEDRSFGALRSPNGDYDAHSRPEESVPEMDQLYADKDAKRFSSSMNEMRAVDNNQIEYLNPLEGSLTSPSMIRHGVDVSSNRQSSASYPRYYPVDSTFNGHSLSSSNEQSWEERFDAPLDTQTTVTTDGNYATPQAYSESYPENIESSQVYPETQEAYSSQYSEQYYANGTYDQQYDAQGYPLDAYGYPIYTAEYDGAYDASYAAQYQQTQGQYDEQQSYTDNSSQYAQQYAETEQYDPSYAEQPYDTTPSYDSQFEQQQYGTEQYEPKSYELQQYHSQQYDSQQYDSQQYRVSTDQQQNDDYNTGEYDQSVYEQESMFPLVSQEQYNTQVTHNPNSYHVNNQQQHWPNQGSGSLLQLDRPQGGESSNSQFVSAAEGEDSLSSIPSVLPEAISPVDSTVTVELDSKLPLTSLSHPRTNSAKPVLFYNPARPSMTPSSSSRSLVDAVDSFTASESLTDSAVAITNRIPKDNRQRKNEPAAATQSMAMDVDAASIAPSSGGVETEAEDDNKKRRHLQIWERFFENALASRSASFDSLHVSSTTTGSLVHSRRSVPNLFTKDQLFFGQSSEAKKYFSLPSAYEVVAPVPSSPSSASSGTAIDLLYRPEFPNLLSAKRYQLLITYAKALGELREHVISYLSFFAATLQRDLSTFQYFLSTDLNVNICDDFGRNIAFYAVFAHAPLEFLALLNDNNLDLDCVDIQGNSLLHFAAAHGDVSVVDFLLQCAVNTEAVNDLSETALDVAKSLTRIDIVHSLETAMNLPLTVFDTSVGSGVMGTSATVSVGKAQVSQADRESRHVTGSDLDTSAEHGIAIDAEKRKGTNGHRHKKESWVDQQEARRKEKEKQHQQQQQPATERGTAKQKAFDRLAQPLPPHEGTIDEVQSLKDVKQQKLAFLQGKSSASRSESHRAVVPVTSTADSLMQSSLSSDNTMNHSDVAGTSTSSFQSLANDVSAGAPAKDVINRREDSQKWQPERAADECDDESPVNVFERLSLVLWSAVISLLDVVLSLFTNRARRQRFSLKYRRKIRRDYKESSDSERDRDFSRRAAPPTDNELREKGLTGRLSPPPDVQLAVAMSRAGRSLTGETPPSSPERDVTSRNASPEQKMNPVGISGIHKPAPLSVATPLSSLSTESDVGDHSPYSTNAQAVGLQSTVNTGDSPVYMSSNTTPQATPTNRNGYSLGGNLPRGVSWRYVNILNENEKP